jgi:hypothetical protein
LLLSPFLTNKKFKALVEDEFSEPRKIKARISNPPETPETHLALFADDTCIYAPDTNVVISANCNATSLQ